MMKKLLTVLLASAFAFSTGLTVAEAADAGPPAQQQKNQVPDTNQNGNYLEAQPDNNGGTNANQKQGTSSKQSKPGNMEKSKRFQQDPKQGGTDVK